MGRPMADQLRIGVVSVQGDVLEHQVMVAKALEALGRRGEATPLRSDKDAEAADAVIIPGGESTTISKLLDRFGVTDVLRRRVEEEDFPILGTCAGAILLAKEGDNQVAKTATRLVGVMDMAVDRNAFGRQRESFETSVEVQGLSSPMPAVFIRAPAITRVWGETKVLSRFQDRIVAASEGRRLALAFHPELTPDSRIHELFLSWV
jgi:pyridoxal 5'-phosphate synthase pdxT subunit